MDMEANYATEANERPLVNIEGKVRDDVHDPVQSTVCLLDFGRVLFQ